MKPEGGPELALPPAPRRPVWAWLAGGALGAAALAGLLWLRSGPKARAELPPLPPLAGEALAYSAKIEISELEPSLWVNALGMEVLYLDGELKNRGSRRVLAAEVTIEFKDQFGQVVLREKVRAIGAPTPAGTPLAPGETRALRATLDRLPRDWNRLPPDVKITGLVLE